MDHERLCQEREKENLVLEQLVKQLRQEVIFLTKVLKRPNDLGAALDSACFSIPFFLMLCVLLTDEEEKYLLRNLLATETPAAPKK